MKRKPWMIVLFVLGVLLIIELAVFLFFFLRAPAVADQVMPGSSAVHVGLQTPSPGTAWPLNAHIPLAISVEAAQPIEAITLFINNVAFETRTFTPETLTRSFAETWSWQPAAIGQFILVVKAVDVVGYTGISQPLLITAVEGAHTVSPLQPAPGQTLQQLADEQQVSLENASAANPGVDPGAPLTGDEHIFLPNDADALTNPNIIPGYTPPVEEIIDPPPLDLGDLPVIELPDPALDPAPEEDPAIPPPPSQIDNFKLWLQNTFVKLPLISGATPEPGAEPTEEPTSEPAPPGKKEYPPIAPRTVGDFKGCDVTVKFDAGSYVDPYDPSFIGRDEDGFFFYRSRDGGPFERIATWPKIVKTEDANIHKDGYVDANQYGLLTYYTSAHKDGVEVPGDPITIPLDPVNCTNPNAHRGGLPQAHLDESGNLVLPYSMDLAYFYIQQVIDETRTQAWRVPEGDRTFLPQSGLKLNIYQYIDSVPQLRQQPDLVLDLQVWGWSGGSLVHAGDFRISLHRSILLVCSQEGAGACTQGGGEWLPEMVMSTAKPVSEQGYEIYWAASKYSPVNDVCFQLAASPYPNDDFWQVSLPIRSYCFDSPGKATSGTFFYEIGKILYPPNQPKSGGYWGVGYHIMEYYSNWFPYDIKEGDAFTLYLRAYPRHQLTGLNRYANIAVMHRYTQPLPSEMPPLASTFESLYDIEILEDSYVPPVFETDQNWGCVIVEEDPTGQYAPGQVVCPPPLGGGDDCEGEWEPWCLLKGFANSLGWLYDYVVWGWDLGKWQYARWIAEIIPYCAASEDCVFVIKTGIDYGLQYATGIPANPPKSEDLIADSIADYIVESAVEGEKYYTGLDVSAIEAFCEVVTDCKKAISDAIKKEMKTARSITSQQACVNGYQAYFHNKQPTCLDPSIIVHPAPGAGNYQASVSVRITRKNTPESLAANLADAGNYRLDLTVWAENTYNNDAINGNLYQTSRTNIPWIAPGESIIISTTLLNCNPGNLPGCQEGTNYYGFETLYFNATAHMKAVEACYSTGSSWEWVPCANGGIDQWDFKNPLDKFSSEVGQP